jgi:gamma-glutamylcyclotransferase (GGCT)/AIG2-like uncharacterized protein YtfP
MTTLLFVYGTLRRRSRHPMARELAAKARFIGAATIAGRLYDLGRYPGLLEGEGRVHGDVYDLGPESEATLRAMDAYENDESPLPAYFERQRARVRLNQGDECDAWVYWFRGEVRADQHIASGQYEKNFD